MVSILDWSVRSVYRSIGKKIGTLSEYDLRPDSIDAFLYVNCLQPNGKVVLDIGANNGDSAKLFLGHGAKKVICVEINERQAKKIKSPHTEVLIEPFRLSHLLISHDCMKMDIEGGEYLLLNYEGQIKPSIIEVHSWILAKQFQMKGWNILTYISPKGVVLMSNFIPAIDGVSGVL